MQVKKISEAAWRTFLADCPGATFFHTPDWYAIWKEYVNYEYEARLLTFASGRKALFPVAWRKRLKGVVKEYFSGPIGTYGGILTSDELNPKEIAAIKNYLAKIRLLEIRFNPLQNVLNADF